MVWLKLLIVITLMQSIEFSTIKEVEKKVRKESKRWDKRGGIEQVQKKCERERKV